ncbi:MAG: hypothetical protein ACPGYL_16045, partial [Rhodospirillaceae bacterium]
ARRTLENATAEAVQARRAYDRAARTALGARRALEQAHAIKPDCSGPNAAEIGLAGLDPEDFEAPGTGVHPNGAKGDLTGDGTAPGFGDYWDQLLTPPEQAEIDLEEPWIDIDDIGPEATDPTGAGALWSDMVGGEAGGPAPTGPDQDGSAPAGFWAGFAAVEANSGTLPPNAVANGGAPASPFSEPPLHPFFGTPMPTGPSPGPPPVTMMPTVPPDMPSIAAQPLPPNNPDGDGITMLPMIPLNPLQPGNPVPGAEPEGNTASNSGTPPSPFSEPPLHPFFGTPMPTGPSAGAPPVTMMPAAPPDMPGIVAQPLPPNNPDGEDFTMMPMIPTGPMQPASPPPVAG